MEELQKEIVSMGNEGAKTTGAGTDSRKEKDWKTTVRKHFTAKRIALMAVFVALSFAVSLISLPIMKATPVFFLELDFGNVFILLIAFLLGPIEGVIVCVIKETIRILAGSTGGVGELANMLMTTGYILLPSVVYRFRKGLKTVTISLVGACLIGTATALLVNRFITFPLYLGAKGAEVFQAGFWYIVLFNLIKTAAISILTLLLYKRMSVFLKKMKI